MAADQLDWVQEQARPWRRRTSPVWLYQRGVEPFEVAPTPRHEHLFVPRDPKLELPLRRFVDNVAEIINSLLRQGVIVKTGQETWALARTGSIVDTRAPTVADDETLGFHPGQFWVDETAHVAYVAISVTQGAAAWRLIS